MRRAVIRHRAVSREATDGWRPLCWMRNPWRRWREKPQASGLKRAGWRNHGRMYCSPIFMISSPVPACRNPGNMPWDCTKPPWRVPIHSCRTPCGLSGNRSTHPQSLWISMPTTASRREPEPATALRISREFPARKEEAAGQGFSIFSIHRRENAVRWWN